MAAANAGRAINKLRVVNIPWTVCDQQLKEYFSQFGYILRAKVVFDKKTGLSKNYGYLEIPEKATWQTIINKTNHHLEGYDLHVRNWY